MSSEAIEAIERAKEAAQHLRRLAAEERVGTLWRETAEAITHLIPLAEAGAKLPRNDRGDIIVPDSIMYVRGREGVQPVRIDGIDWDGEWTMHATAGGNAGIMFDDPNDLYASRDAAEQARKAGT